MNRIEQIFKRLRDEDRRAVMPFVTAGDPSLEVLGDVLVAISDAGASICEVGIPFSDPIADGPVIQASMTRALDRGTTVSGVFEQVRAVRDRVSAGLVAMVSYSIVHRRGIDHFCQQAAAAGFDGLIFPDMPLEESAKASKAAQQADLILSMLVAPTTDIQRARQIAQAGSGFVYVVSRSGITGEQAALPVGLEDRLDALREVTDLPLAVGFGISSSDQVRAVTAHADAAIVGSALVRHIHEHAADGRETVIDAAAAMVRELVSGLPTDSKPAD